MNSENFMAVAKQTRAGKMEKRTVAHNEDNAFHKRPRLENQTEEKSRQVNEKFQKLLPSVVHSAEGQSTLHHVSIHPLLQSLTTNTAKKNPSVLLDNIKSSENPYLSSLNERDMIARPSKKSFKFHRTGKFVEQAEQMRKEEQIAKLRKKIATSLKKSGMEKDLELIGDFAVKKNLVPIVEWWDAQFLKTGNYVDVESGNISMDWLKDAMYIPPLLSAPNVPDVIPPPPVMLTKEEKKKMRRLRRNAVHQKKQEEIKLGFRKPDPPKMKLSTFMKILKNESVQDPTLLESQVRAQIQKRLSDHQAANAERKLTPEEKKAKKRRKMFEDTAVSTHVSLYKISKLDDPSIKFKLRVNASQNSLTGRLISMPDFHLIIVEGGAKSLKRYKRLCLHRIQWPEDNQCNLIWEGSISKRQFFGFKDELFESEYDAVEFLKDLECEHYLRYAKEFMNAKTIL